MEICIRHYITAFSATLQTVRLKFCTLSHRQNSLSRSLDRHLQIILPSHLGQAPDLELAGFVESMVKDPERTVDMLAQLSD